MSVGIITKTGKSFGFGEMFFVLFGEVGISFYLCRKKRMKKQASRAFLGISPVFLDYSRNAILNFLFILPHTDYQFSILPQHNNHFCIF